MTKWEYLSTRETENWNELGEQGWEYIGTFHRQEYDAGDEGNGIYHTIEVYTEYRFKRSIKSPEVWESLVTEPDEYEAGTIYPDRIFDYCQQGWELVTVTNGGYCIFKRRVE